MKILVVGGGGREHALSWALDRSPGVSRLRCAPGNAGIASVAESVEIGAENVDALFEHATAEKYDLVVVGPEAPLVAGLADRLRDAGTRVFGPSASRIEGALVTFTASPQSGAFDGSKTRFTAADPTGVVAALFLAFALITLRLVRLGDAAASCGCFGRLSSRPSPVATVSQCTRAWSTRIGPHSSTSVSPWRRGGGRDAEGPRVRGPARCDRNGPHARRDSTRCPGGSGRGETGGLASAP